MNEQHLMAYFIAERDEAIVFVAVGLLAVIASAWIVLAKRGWRGATVPLLLVAAIQLVVGGSVWQRTDAQIAALTQQLRSDPAAFQRAEGTRMAVVNRNFGAYKLVEVGLLALGAGLVVVTARRRGEATRSRRNAYWRAFGAGLALQAGFMLALDFFAEARADDYTRRIAALPLP